MDRLQQVGKSSIGESWGEEYQLMYDEIKDNDFKIDLQNKEFTFQRLGNGTLSSITYLERFKKKNSNNLTKLYTY